MIDSEFYQLIKNQPNSVLLETLNVDSENTRSFVFLKPIDVIETLSLDQIPSIFQRIEEELSKGRYVAGYLVYECGYHFDDVIQGVTSASPFVWFGVYENPIVYNHSLNKWFGLQKQNNQETNSDHYSIDDIRFIVGDSSRDLTEENYRSAIAVIKNYIESGDVYQINFTGRILFCFKGSIIALYDTLKKKQRVAYGGILQTNRETIISLSPELFFRRHGDRIITRPMKGTARRGRTNREDNEIREWLRADEKSRAENVMIVDILRNDLGKISVIGSVKTVDLFSVEQYETLFQMTSTIESTLLPNVSYYEIFKALFPSGSVTGAPKIRAMQIIHELEKSPREVYTGAIGFISPNDEAVFNVAIRTIALRNRDGMFGTGGGIVSDSDSKSEYEECLLKAEFLLSKPVDEFVLIETILWDHGYKLIDKHLKRLEESAKYFGYPHALDETSSLLNNATDKFNLQRCYKVRLTLDRSGKCTVESWEIDNTPGSERELIMLSKVRTYSENKFLYHKTSMRHVYDSSYRDAVGRRFFDVIFMNEKNQITEGAISNIWIKKNGKYLTPPITCGLLNGVYRQYLLETQVNASEEILSLDDLLSAESIYVCNAIRGLRTVELCQD